MKIQCPRCRDIVELQEFSTSDAGLRLRCPACREESFLANAHSLGGPGPAAGAGTAPRPPAGPVTCPKCGNAQADPVACHRCGLVFAKFDPALLPPDPPEAARLWAEVLARPADEGAHDLFVAACDRVGRLDYATRQYRLLLQQGGPPALVQRMQQRILQLAQAKLLPGGLQPTDREASKGRARWFIYALLLLAIAGLSYLIYTASDMLRTMR